MGIPNSFNPMGAYGAYGCVKPGQAVAVTSFNGEKHVIFDAATREGGEYFFQKSDITSFDIPMPLLKKGDYMFNSCGSLVSFTAPMPLLETAERMFEYTQNLQTWQCELPALKNANYMFHSGSNLFEEWTTDLPEATSAVGMFSGTKGLKRFAAAVPKLKEGSEMFYACRDFTEFYAGGEGLKSLTRGVRMFASCSIDAASARHVLDTIPDRTGLSAAELHLGKRTNYKDDPDVQALLGQPGEEITAKTYSFKNWNITVTD